MVVGLVFIGLFVVVPCVWIYYQVRKGGGK